MRSLSEERHTMLGEIGEKIFGLPSNQLKVLYDLLEKLSGRNKERCLAELKKYLREEETWVKKRLLKCISEDKIVLKATDESINEKMIWLKLNEIFEHHDLQHNRSLISKCKKTDKAPIRVYEAENDTTLSNSSQAFYELNTCRSKLSLTISQVCNFVEEYGKSFLQEDPPKEYPNKYLLFLIGEDYIGTVRYYPSLGENGEFQLTTTSNSDVINNDVILIVLDELN